MLEGSNLTLFCNAPGNPQPDITWTKEGYSSVLSISETLNLTNLRREDNGAVYSCKANNSLGFATVVSSITVRCEYRKKNLCNSVLKLALSCFTLDRFGHKDPVSRKKPKNLRR